MDDVSEFIRALAALAWPTVLGVFLWRFRHELRRLLGRMEEASGAGVSLKFGKELDRLNESAEAAIQSLPPAATDVDEDDLAPAVRNALDDAARSPKAALILLSAELERRVRQLAAQTGQMFANPKIWHGRPVSANTLRLFNVPPAVLDAVEQFRDVRRRVIHGGDVSDEEALRAVDSAVLILEALDRVPREVNFVHAADVPLFADAEGRQERDGVKAVVLRTFHTDTPDKDTLRVFPTTRTHFRKGEPVAWDWDMSKVWPESWFRHPDTGAIEYAFGASGEFIGTPLAEV